MKHTVTLGLLLLMGCVHTPTHQVSIARTFSTHTQGQMLEGSMTPSTTLEEVDNPYERMEEEERNPYESMEEAEKNPYEEMEREQKKPHPYICADGDPLCDTLEK